MANVLIVHATKHGQTQKIAQRMCAALREHGHGVQLVDASRPPEGLDVWRFDVTVVGAPIYASHYPASIARFVQTHREFLLRAPSAFFSVSLAVASHTSEGRAETMLIVERFIEETGWRPARVELIAGALSYTKYNFLIRFIMRRIARKAGGSTDTSRDHEYTDWAAVDRFALEVVDQISDEGATRAPLSPVPREPAPTLRESAPSRP